MPNLAIIGYGKMGRMIEQLAPEYGFSVAAKVDLGARPSLAGIEVAVEFTVASSVADNVEWLAAAGIPVVVGTTGWSADLEHIKAAIAKHGTALVWSPNFSVGVNVFARIVETAATLMKDETDYGAWGWEMHHATKKDAPSGTMLKLVQQMRAAGYDREVNVCSNRAGHVPGTHEIGFDSVADSITVRHTARSREGFARGALRAAKWIIGRKGFYEFQDVLFPPQRAKTGPAGDPDTGGQ